MRPVRDHAACAIIIALIAACPLDTSGVGGVGDTHGTIESSDGATVDSSGSASGTTAVSVTAGDASAESGEPTSGVDSTGAPEGTSTDDTTGPVDTCAGDAPQFVLAIPVEQANVVEPMMLDMQDETPYAYSEIAEMGGATFTFDVPCPDQYMFHGYVYDGDPGAWNIPSFTDNGADSYLLQVEGTNVVWNYGCQTGGVFPPNWQWQPISNNAECADNTVIVALPAGKHTVTLVNIEAGTNAVDTPGTAAAIAVLVVTNDPTYAP